MKLQEHPIDQPTRQVNQQSMKIIHTITFALALLSPLPPAQAGLVTLLAGESYQLSSNDVAEVLSVLPGSASYTNGNFGIYVNTILLVDGRPVVTAATFNGGSSVNLATSAFASLQPALISGPRTISSYNNSSITGNYTSYSLVTLRITDKLTFEQSRNSSAPALTAVIPNDPGNFNVLLESSNDLVTWYLVKSQL